MTSSDGGGEWVVMIVKGKLDEPIEDAHEEEKKK